MATNPGDAEFWKTAAKDQSDKKDAEEQMRNIAKTELRSALKPLEERLDAIEAILAAREQ